MLRISKMTDYATVVLGVLAQEPARRLSATQLTQRTHLSGATVSKVLKRLQRAGLVNSMRGAHGGYMLGRAADQISAAAILDALEGPLQLTECAAGHGQCDIEMTCQVGTSWRRVNLAVRRVLSEVNLAQLAGLERLESVVAAPRSWPQGRSGIALDRGHR